MKLPRSRMGWKEFVKALARQTARHELLRVADAVTFSATMTLLPLIPFLLFVATRLVAAAKAERAIQQLGDVPPKDVMLVFASHLPRLASGQNTVLLTLGALAATLAAWSGVSTLRKALNVVYGVREQRPFWRRHGVALVATILAGVVSLAAALIVIAAPAVAEGLRGPARTIVLWLRLPVAAGLMTFVWAMLYHVLPDVEQSFRFLTMGSAVGVLVWMLASIGLSVYVSRIGRYATTYGPVGGILAMLLWTWISALMLVIGAEANAILEHTSHEGKRAGAKRLRDSGASEVC